MKKAAKDLLLQLEPFAETHKSVIENLINKLKLEKEQKLLPFFKDKLATLKDNPIDEPKLQEAREKINKRIEDGEIDTTDALLIITDEIYTEDEIENLKQKHNLKDIEIQEIINFGSAISVKVFGYTYEDENKNDVLKEIASQNELQPLSYSNKRKIRDILKSQTKAFDNVMEESKKIQRLVDDGEDVEERMKASNEVYEAAMKDIEVDKKTILSMSNLDTSEMTEWGKELLYKKLVANTNGSYTPPMGKN